MAFDKQTRTGNEFSGSAHLVGPFVVASDVPVRVFCMVCYEMTVLLCTRAGDRVAGYVLASVLRLVMMGTRNERGTAR